MAFNRKNAGSYGWLGLAGYILIWDLMGISKDFELLTEAWRRGLAHPKRRWLVIVSWLLTTKHLFFGGFLPWLDPFHAIGWSAKKLFNIGGNI